MRDMVGGLKEKMCHTNGWQEGKEQKQKENIKNWGAARPVSEPHF